MSDSRRFTINQGFLFPGHGTQKPGMGRFLLDRFSWFSSLLEELKAGDYGIEDITEYLRSSAATELDEVSAQVAIHLVNLGYDRALKEAGISPGITCGYSSGIYSAIYSSGAIDLETSLFLVRSAGQLMIDCVQSSGREMGMIAVTGLTRERIDEVISKLRKGGFVSLANVNSPRQFYLSGERKCLEAAMELCRQPGLLTLRQLPVSVPYHSELIAPAALKFAGVVNSISIRDPKLPVIVGSDGSIADTAAGIKQLLRRQLMDSVDFPRCIDTLVESDMTHLWEVGEGNFLSKLLRQNPRAATVVLVKDWLTNLRV
jgi:[acyl-carrier-protein] S-malonyltransferase